MNRYAMQHIVDSAYCFPVSEKEIVLRLRTAKDDIKSVQIIYESKYVFGQSQKRAEMQKTYTSELYDYYVIHLVLEDTRLAYVFYLNDGEKNYFFSEDGITESYDYALGYYNFFQYPYINTNDIMPSVDWMKNISFYQIFVDRFCKGNEEKDCSYINCKWGDIPTPSTFAGGDLQGIIEKLDYIKELGCTALYLTPIFQSISNHKYDIADYYKIDEHFGSGEDLYNLVQEAHKRGMRVVLDAVFNHCSEKLVQFRQVLEKGRQSEYYDWFVIQGDKPDPEKHNYETFAQCTYMPKFNTANPEVQKFLIDIGCYYITEYNIDGWRLDVSDEVSHDFWRQFRKAIKACKRDAVIIGENWHDAYSNLRGEQYDSIMNYAFTKACLDFFAKESINAKELAYKLNSLLMRNTDIVNGMMLNLLDSHDTHRFYSEVNKNKLKMTEALCLLYLFPGVPCIFYGTEILTHGGYDPDCRRCMDWEKASFDGEYKDIYKLLQELSQIRQRYDVAGGNVKIYEEQGVFVLENSTVQRKLWLMINNTDKNATVNNQEVKKQSCQIIVTEDKRKKELLYV
ncbi:MAG: alpha-glycosidase [Lachnospiraceae bacterium]|nr:alpha-glycosidase [Lachnospiraceae bacterium]